MLEQLPACSEPAQFSKWSEQLATLPAPVQAAVAEALLERSLELYLNPTEHCNFRCSYCYEDFSLGRMSPETVQAVKTLIEKKTPGRKTLLLSWFGGEPLVAADVVLNISSHAKDVCEKHGCKLIGGISTNGYLLRPQLMAQLVELKQSSFQIALDGDKEAHDAVRRRADSMGTFETIWGNLSDLKATDLPFLINLRVHLRPCNAESVERLLLQIADIVLGDSRFWVRLNPLTQMGGTAAGTYETLADSEFEHLAERLIASFKGRISIGYNWGDSPRLSSGTIAQHLCYACKPNSFLIRSDGRVCKCTVAFDKEYNVIGVLRADGELEVAAEKLQKWTLGMKTLDAQDLSCPFHKGDAFFIR